MFNYILLIALLAGCSGRGPEPSTRTSPASKPPPVVLPAVLEGAGSCVSPTCTMHFAAAASGDAASFSAARCDDGSCPVRKARLTAAAQAKARDIGARLAGMKLEENYGCPGCADGPIYVAVVHHAGGFSSHHSFDPLGPEALPQPLQDASALIESVASALQRCESTELVQVEADCAQVNSQDEGRATGRP